MRSVRWLNRNLLLLSLVALFLFGHTSLLHAQVSSRDSPDEAALEKAAATDRGIAFPLEFTSEILGNIRGGSSHRVIWESLLNLGVILDLEKLAHWPGASMSIRAIYPWGSSLTDRAVHDFDTLSNIDGYDSPRLYDVWLEQLFFDGKFSIRAGQLLADAEFFDSAYAALFLNSSFGALPLVSQNLDAPIFPVASPGIRFRADPGSHFVIKSAIFSGDAGDPSEDNKHNTRFSFRAQDGLLLFAEIDYQWHPKPADASDDRTCLLTGICKLGGFYDTKSFPDYRDSRSDHGDYSVYAVIDQELWHPAGDTARGLSGFARAGAAPNDRNIVTAYGDIGINFQGLLLSRKDDLLGLACSYTRLSNKLRAETGKSYPAHHESVLELTYQFAVGSHSGLQPDLQFIFNPGALHPAPTAVVMGLRWNVRF